MDPHRHERVTESIREELEELINYELSDPRIGTVSVAEAHVSPDHRHAHVLLNLGGSPTEQAATLNAIEHAKQFLRHQLADRLQMFKTPELHFEAALDPNLAAKAPKILRRMRRGRPQTNGVANTAESAPETAKAASPKPAGTPKTGSKRP